MLNFRDILSGMTDELMPSKKTTTPSDDFARRLPLGDNSGATAGTGQPDDFQYAGRGAGKGSGGLSTTVTKGNPYLGALGGVNKAFQDDQSGPSMMSPIAIDPGMQVQLQPQIPYNMRGLANGGEIGDGETVQVGENGKELVHKTADGKVFVLPNPQTLMQPQTATPEQYGLDQTVQGDDTRMDSGQPDNFQYAGRGTPDGQTVTPSVGVGGKVMPNPQDLMSGNLSPAQQKLADALSRYAVAGQVHPNGFKDTAYGALQGINNALNRSNAPIQNYSQMKAQRRQAMLEPELQADQASVGLDEAATKQREDAADKASKRAYEGAETQYTLGRNDATIAGKQATAQAGNLRALNRKQIWDPKNPADVALAKASGMTDEQIGQMQPWNYSNPYTQKIGADTYEYDKTLGAWKPSGLPTDDAKKLNPYEMKEDDDNGNEHVTATYYLTDPQAAKMAQQAQLQRQRLSAAKDMQSTREGAATDRATASRTFKLQDAATHDIKTARQSLGAIAVAAPKHTSHEDIVAKQHDYWMALSPEVQKQIPEPK